MERETWTAVIVGPDSVHPHRIVGRGGRTVAEVDSDQPGAASDAAMLAGASLMYPALARLLAWAEEANSRLAFEMDKATGFQMGGNPGLNPAFREARAALAGSRLAR